MLRIIILMFVSVIGVLADDSNASQIKAVERRLDKLEHKQQRLASDERRVKSRLNKIERDIGSAGFGLFVSGVLCALWAQYSRRSAWAWFFMGLIFAPVALIALLWKTSNDLHSGRMRYWDGGANYNR